MEGMNIMELQLGDVQETALIPLAVRANETKRENARIHDGKAVEIIETLGIDTKDIDSFPMRAWWRERSCLTGL